MNSLFDFAVSQVAVVKMDMWECILLTMITSAVQQHDLDFDNIWLGQLASLWCPVEEWCLLLFLWKCPSGRRWICFFFSVRRVTCCLWISQATYLLGYLLASSR